MAKLVVFTFSLLFSICIYSQEAVIPASTYAKLPKKSMFAVSPSGNYAAYRNVADGRDLVFIVDLSNFSLVNAVDVSGVNPNSLYFADEEKLIMVVTKNKVIQGYRGRYEVSAAFAYNVKSQKIYQMLVPGSGITAGQTNVGTIVGISKDKKYAFMPAYDEEDSYNLYKVNLTKKSRPRILKRGTSDTIDFFMGDNDTIVARERFTRSKSKKKHIIESFISGKWKTIYSQETDYITRGFVGLTPDKQSLFMSITTDDLRSYYKMSLVDGAITGPIFSQDDKGIEHPITDLNRIVYGVEYSGFEPTYEFFEEKLNARIGGVNHALPDLTIHIKDYSSDWENIIFYTDGKNSAGSYFLYKSGKLTLLASSRPDLPVSGISDVKEYSYTARDGLEIPTLLTFPKNKGENNLPAIMMPHGGPESYDKKNFDYLAQYFANRGYLVIQPQFRGSKGFGASHTLKGRGEWGRKMQDDLTDGVETLIKEGIVDGSKVCIVGASYGGYAALAGAVFTPELYKCVISINGVSNLPKMMSSERRQYGRNHWVIAYWDDVISGGEFDKSHLKSISPANHVENIQAPVLLIHGEYDKVVPWSQSDYMLSKMKRAKKDVTFVKLPKGDHHLSTSENRLKAMEAIDDFMNTHM